MLVQQNDDFNHYKVEDSSMDEFALAIKNQKEMLPREESFRMSYLEAKFNHFRKIETP